MTPMEVLEAIKVEQIQIEGKAVRMAKFFEGLAVANDAIEKQIPKKPIIKRMKIQCVNGHNQPVQHYKYCPMCGQLMDWSDNNVE